MRIFICVLIVLLVPVAGFGEPFLVCDAQSEVTEYKIAWDSGATEYVNAETDGSLRYDLVSAGIHEGDLFAGKPWTLDGEDQPAFKWSASRPFVLGEPSDVNIPSGLRLTK